MSVSELKRYILKSKYARHRREERRRETYSEAVHRVRDMMREKYPQSREVIDWAYGEVEQEVALGSQRAMQFGGKPTIQHNARMYNCTCSYADRLRFFQEAFYLLLCGCGVGFSVQKHHVAKLPVFEGREYERVRQPWVMVDSVPTKVFVIPDTIEGWSDALGILLSSYFKDGPFPEYFGYHVDFDFRLIRRKGAYLSSGAGRAPGPQPLINTLLKIRNLIDRCIGSGQDRLRPVDVYDIVMHTSDAVLAGGVRRSATICVFSPDDLDMLRAKTGDWLNDNPQRARSNNSALLVRHRTTPEQFEEMMGYVREWGEPGFVWADSTEFLVNPCLHPDTLLATEKGLLRVGDLAAHSEAIRVTSDDRVGTGSTLHRDDFGVSLHDATPVVLTQKQAPVYLVETEHGHHLKVTETHEFPTLRGRLKLCDMQVGDTILLPSGEGSFGNQGSLGDGFIVGAITGDGLISEKRAFVEVWEEDFDDLADISAKMNASIGGLPSINYGGRTWGENQWHKPKTTLACQKTRIGGRRLYRHLVERLGITDPHAIKQRVPDCVLRGSREMVRGYLQGLFFADGTINLSGHKNIPTLSFRINQSNPELLRDVQVLLGQFGIVSRITLRRQAGYHMLPDGRGGQSSYYCKDNYDLILNRPNSIRFFDEVGIYGRKQQVAANLIDYCGRSCRKSERFISKIKSITPCGTSDVYCLTQFDTNAVVAQGCVTGQCVEIGMWPSLRLPTNSDILREYRGPVGYDSGDMAVASGWQFCNLTTINGNKVRTADDFYHACRVAATVGTLQAGFSDFPYLGRVTEEIVRREALLGVSITSIMSNPAVMLNPEVLRHGASIVLEANAEIANRIGIHPCARATCLKPEGTSTLMLGSLASGVHGWPFRKGIRHVQANTGEAVYQWFREHNPEACEKSIWCANGSTDVIAFPVEAPDEAWLQEQFTAIEFLECVKNVYLNWVVPGKRPERCTQQWLHHSVSNTVKVRNEEWPQVTRFIFENRHSFAGISLLSWSGDKDYPQAPNVAVYSPSETIAEYGQAAYAKGLELYERLYAAYAGNVWLACSECTSVKDPATQEQEEVKLLFEHVAQTYLGSDKQRLSYLIKDIDAWRRYEMLKETIREVDYEALIEENDATRPEDEMSCAGGACSLL